MRCIYAHPDNLNQFNQGDAGLLVQISLSASSATRALKSAP